jgi:hypothetical protein
MSRRENRGGAPGEFVPRRLILKTLATSGVLLSGACEQATPEAPSEASLHSAYRQNLVSSPIRRENELTGSDGFGLGQPALAAEVEAYSCPTSVVAGDTVDVFVNVMQAQGVRFELYRIGYYQGLGGRLVSSGESVPVSPQTVPVADPNTGLIECNWEIAFSILIDPDWVTGYYLIKVIADNGFETHSPFVVRESGRRAPLLAQASATTWQAYNGWGGLSLYHNQTDRSQFAAGRAYQVSFDRPFLLTEQVWLEEFAMVRWLEQGGYDVAYVTNMDLDATPDLLTDRRLFMSVGHDEYWSVTARSAVENARDQGLSMAFFSGNTSYRRIRLDNSSIGIERRTVTCYKSSTLDPISNAPDTTADFGDSPYPRPEIDLLGLRWNGWAYLDGFPFVVTNPDHWVYDGTGVSANDTLGHIIGYEWDCVGDDSPTGVEVVGDSSIVHEYGYTSQSNAIVFYPTPTSFVFSAGTIGWARALSIPGLVDSRLQRVTQNILARARVFPELSVVGAPPPPSATGSSERSAVVAGTGSAGSADGAALAAQFNAPTGVAVGLGGELYVSDTGNQLVRKISADGQVTTVLGGGAAIAKTQLNTPTGIAVDASGVVYISDTNNNRIILLDLDGKARVFAGGAAGSADATNPRKAGFSAPHGLAFDASGALYVADYSNDAIRRIDSSGVTTVVTSAGGPTAVAIGPDGTIYYVATWNGSIVSVTKDGTSTTLANINSYGDQIGPGATAQLRPVDGLVFTPQGLVVSDTGNNRMRFVAFDPQNTVSNLLGNGQAGAGVGDGIDSQVVLPRGVAAFNGGYVVADSMNHRILWFSAAAS